MRSIVEQIFHRADKTPDKTALIEGKQLISYKELACRIVHVKHLLVDTFQLKQGDRIMLAAHKQPGFVYAYFAAHLLGVIIIPIDSDTNPERLNFIIQKTEPALIVGFSKLKEQYPCITFDIFEAGEFGDEIITPQVFPSLESTADIIFTTGTTGEPKGVVLSHKNIAASAHNINAFVGNKVADVELLALPISHSFGLGRLRCSLSIGATLILLGSFVNMKRFFRLIEDYKVSGLAMVPASWAFIKKMSGTKIGEYAKQLAYVEIGSAPMPLEEKQLLMTLLPTTRICMHYGLTEASRSTFIEFHSEANKLNTAGKASPNVTIAVKDENGLELPAGVEGEVCIQGDSVTKEYWRNNESSSDYFWGDYFRTGDLGYLDQDNYLILKSRKKEIINVGGKKVSPIEVESALLTINGIKECACIGIDDPEQVLGEVVKVFIVKDDNVLLTFDEIKKELDKKLENYKIPVAYEWIKEIPKTSSGKIQRLLLKK